jgi:hypothetical protein
MHFLYRHFMEVSGHHALAALLFGKEQLESFEYEKRVSRSAGLGSEPRSSSL